MRFRKRVHAHQIEYRASTRVNMETIEKECCVCGYHVYKNIWDASIGGELACQREPSNGVDRYVVAAKFLAVKFSTFIATDEISPPSKNTRYTMKRHRRQDSVCLRSIVT